MEKEKFMIKSIDHITINMEKRWESEQFYGEVMGFARQREVKMEDSLIIYYALPGDVRLELIESFASVPRSTDVQCTPGCYRHLAFRTDSLEICREKCKNAGIPVIIEPTFLEKLNCRVMLIHDPNGVEIEFIESVS